MIKSKGFDLFEGTLLAGDGLVVPINCPSEKDLHKFKSKQIRRRIKFSTTFTLKSLNPQLIKSYFFHNGAFPAFGVLDAGI